MAKKTISYYGKLPSHGDFISQHMPRAFTDVWHSWLQENLLQWRHTFQKHWVENYITMKAYRFILSSGIAGEVIWCGVLIPSRDKAGRLFPFTACIPLSPKETNSLALFETHQHWLEQLEELAITYLLSDLDKETLQEKFQQDLEKLAEQCPNNAEQSDAFTCKTESLNTQQPSFAWHSSSLKDSKHPAVSDFSPSLLDSLLGEYCYTYSIWWTKNNTDIMLCQGLPSVDLTPALIDEKWKQWNWLTDTPPVPNDNKEEEMTPVTSNDDDDDDVTITF